MRSTPTTDSGCLSSAFLPRWITSVVTHSTPRPNRMPMYGGRWVTVLNTGTNSSEPRPRASTRLRSKSVVGQRCSSPRWARWRGRGASPLRRKLRISSGTSRHTRLGRNRPRITPEALIWLPIHSMVVVTSPIGDQAPPALAAITTTPTYIQRSGRPRTSLRSSETMTMVVVRLSSTAERKKVMKPTIHSRCTRLRVWMRSVTARKPSWESISSTMVIAPSRKNRISEISPRWWRSSVTTPWPASAAGRMLPSPRTSTVQHSTAVRMAEAALSIFSGCSRAMQR
ncbi:hypothetical protein D3C80_1346520 [compost metagenome]